MNIEAYILIGGRSSRLGSDKAFVKVGGKTLAEHALQTVRVGLSPAKAIFVAGDAAAFAIEALTLDAPFIFDLVPGRGPLGGLHAALSYARTEWIFVFACDYPFVSAELLKMLDGSVSDEFASVIPEQQDNRLQPLCAFYKVAAARPIVEEIIARPRVPPPLQEIVRGLKPKVVVFDEYRHLPNADDIFTNINTPKDLEEARKIDCKISAG